MSIASKKHRNEPNVYLNPMSYYIYKKTRTTNQQPLSFFNFLFPFFLKSNHNTIPLISRQDKKHSKTLIPLFFFFFFSVPPTRESNRTKPNPPFSSFFFTVHQTSKSTKPIFCLFVQYSIFQQWRIIGVRRVITRRRRRAARITGEEGTTRSKSVTLSRMGAMLCRESLGGATSQLSGSLGTLKDR